MKKWQSEICLFILKKAILQQLSVPTELVNLLCLMPSVEIFSQIPDLLFWMERILHFCHSMPEQKNIGRLYQDPMRGTAPGMTILENLALAAGQGGWLSRISKSDKQRFREQLALLDIGLEDRMNHPVGLLSGGQRQALTLLMATMNPPKLLLLDEHTAALDPGTAEKVLNLTSRIVEEHHLTCLMITHNMQSALELGNRILMMDSGDIVLDIKEEEKKGLTVEGLLDKFKVGAGKKLDNDRILLSNE